MEALSLKQEAHAKSETLALGTSLNLTLVIFAQAFHPLLGVFSNTDCKNRGQLSRVRLKFRYSSGVGRML
jgi:hypothetical protein